MTAAQVSDRGRYLTTDGRLSNFSTVEMRCRCGGCESDAMAAALIDVLQSVRDAIGRPLRVLSGVRCPEHNRAQGGAPNSWHVPQFHEGLGWAADVYADGVPADELAIHAARALRPSIGGIGLYTGRIHVDVRPGAAFWSG